VGEIRGNGARGTPFPVGYPKRVSVAVGKLPDVGDFAPIHHKAYRHTFREGIVNIRTWILVLPLFVSIDAFGHGGGLDSKGCHTNRKTGDYHCHRAQTPPATTSNSLHSSSPAAEGRAFKNCTEARAAGAAPVKRGDPGYGPHLDRDNDGIGCE
jgi:hypothetical protein